MIISVKYIIYLNHKFDIFQCSHYSISFFKKANLKSRIDNEKNMKVSILFSFENQTVVSEKCICKQFKKLTFFGLYWRNHHFMVNNFYRFSNFAAYNAHIFAILNINE